MHASSKIEEIDVGLITDKDESLSRKSDVVPTDVLQKHHTAFTANHHGLFGRRIHYSRVLTTVENHFVGVLFDPFDKHCMSR